MAPPKKDLAVTDNANIATLCLLMSTATEFKVDFNALSESMGGMLAKNLPRKINSIISPHGFEWKSGRVIKTSDDVDATPQTPKAPKNVNTPSSDADNEQGTTAKKAGVKRKAPAPKSPSKKPAKFMPAAKKSKLDKDASTGPVEGDEEVTGPVKKETGDGTDSEGDAGEEV